MRLTPYVLVTLLVVAFAAPVAHAMPDPGPVKTHANGFGKSDAAQTAPARKRAREQRSATLNDVAAEVDRLPGPPTWPTNPRPVTQVRAAPAEPAGDDGFAWDAIAIALAGAALALTAAGTVVGLRRRSQRPRVAA
jgi:hypothetical protein